MLLLNVYFCYLCILLELFYCLYNYTGVDVMFICVYLSVIIHLQYLPDNCSAEGTHTFMCNSLFS